MPRKITAKIKKALEKAWKTGAISLGDVCPSCFKSMGAFGHGKCQHCGKGCGCSFNPTSSSDYCSFHGGTW